MGKDLSFLNGKYRERARFACLARFFLFLFYPFALDSSLTVGSKSRQFNLSEEEEEEEERPLARSLTNVSSVA